MLFSVMGCTLSAVAFILSLLAMSRVADWVQAHTGSHFLGGMAAVAVFPIVYTVLYTGCFLGDIIAKQR